MTLLDILPSLGHAAPPRFDPAIWPVTAHPDEEGRLCVGGVPLGDVADEFGTPVYVVDEADFRCRARGTAGRCAASRWSTPASRC